MTCPYCPAYEEPAPTCVPALAATTLSHWLINTASFSSARARRVPYWRLARPSRQENLPVHRRLMHEVQSEF
jgi:hypothetical protein